MQLSAPFGLFSLSLHGIPVLHLGRNLVERSSETDSYWVEEAKLGFAVGLEKQRRSAGMTYAAIAKKIGTSAAYITKIFRGDTNVTIESMVKLARATGGRLEVNVVNSVVAAPV